MERAAAPIKKADLLLIAEHVIGNLPYNRVPVLVKRHKIDVEKNGTSPHELLAKHVATFDETGLCRLLLEASLIESAYAAGVWRQVLFPVRSLSPQLAANRTMTAFSTQRNAIA